VVLKIDSLTKDYGKKFWVLNGFSLVVEKGMFGL